MKTQEEINTLQQELETMNKKLSELNDDELDQVTGGKIRGCYNIVLLLIGSIFLKLVTVSKEDIDRIGQLIKENKIEEACKLILELEIPDEKKQEIIKIIRRYIGNV